MEPESQQSELRAVFMGTPGGYTSSKTRVGLMGWGIRKGQLSMDHSQR